MRQRKRMRSALPKNNPIVLWKRRASFAALFLSFVCQALLAAPQGALLVDNFDQGVQNQLGGYRNTFFAAPSTAQAQRITDARRGRSVRIQTQRQPTGFCGYWIHFFDMRSAGPAQFFDARQHRYLSFWVRGQHGAEDFQIKLADKSLIEKEDAVALGKVSRFLPRGIRTEWQEVVVPLPRRLKLDWSQLGGLTFEFETPGESVVYVDDISFKREPRERLLPLQPKTHEERIVRRCSRRLWVWSSQELLEDPAARQQLIDFCGAHHIDAIWLQLLYTLDVQPADRRGDLRDAPAARCLIRFRDELCAFLREAHQANIQIHALDGYPEFCQREYHHIPLAVVDAVLQFNRENRTSERFDGVHFDNEPYLLVGWQEAGRREQILREFLDLNAECQRRLKEKSKMEFGIDIPFWWQEFDERTGRINAEVLYRGRRQAASYHCLEMLDNVGVMNYRDTADGADGMIAHGRDLLEFADRAGRAQVYMGIETFRSEPTTVWFSVGLPRQKFEEAIRGKAVRFAQLSRLNEFRLRTWDDGHNVHLGIELPAVDDHQTRSRATKTMLEIARHLGAAADNIYRNHIPLIVQQAEKAVRADVEWNGFRLREIRDLNGHENLAGFAADSIMLSKITFADDSYSRLQQEIANAEAFFCRHPSYHGLAIHYYKTFRQKVSEDISQ